MGYSMHGPFSNSDVDAAEDVVTLKVRDMEELFLSFVVGTANLSAFTVEYRVAPEGGWFTVASAAGDYTSPDGVILGASGDLTTAAAGSTVHWLNLSVKAVHDIRIRAAGTSSTISGHWGAN